MSPDGDQIIDVIGEGKADVGDDPAPRTPREGIVPILVHTLCGKPKRMLVRQRKIASLEGKGFLWKVKLAKRQLQYGRSAGAVFVVDSEGGSKELEKRRRELEKCRAEVLPDFPMAIGVAHPCIEAWLLADATAVRRAFDLAVSPQVTDEPEKLPAPRNDRRNNPKTVLAKAVESAKGDLSAAEKDRIALAMNDMKLVRERCPQGFAPFADEVEQRIRPLF